MEVEEAPEGPEPSTLPEVSVPEPGSAPGHRLLSGHCYSTQIKVLTVEISIQGAASPCFYTRTHRRGLRGDGG